MAITKFEDYLSNVLIKQQFQESDGMKSVISIPSKFTVLYLVSSTRVLSVYLRIAALHRIKNFNYFDPEFTISSKKKKNVKDLEAFANDTMYTTYEWESSVLINEPSRASGRYFRLKWLSHRANSQVTETNEFFFFFFRAKNKSQRYTRYVAACNIASIFNRAWSRFNLFGNSFNCLRMFIRLFGFFRLVLIFLSILLKKLRYFLGSHGFLFPLGIVKNTRI